MLACVVCAKNGAEEGSPPSLAPAPNPATKDSVKSLTSQIKDMVLKFSGTYRQCKTSGASASTAYHSRSHHHHHCSLPYAKNGDGASDGGTCYTYLRAAGPSSTPAWDFSSVKHVSESTNLDYGSKWIPGIGPAVLEEDTDEPKEWTAQVEPGVQITFVSLAGGTGNDLKRIRFSREIFNKLQAQIWWGENYDRIVELYNVQRFSRQALPTPRSDDGERGSSCSRVGSTRESPMTQPFCRDNVYYHNTGKNPIASSSREHFASVPDTLERMFPQPHRLNPVPSHAMIGASGGIRGEASSLDASRTTTSSRDEPSVSISNASDPDVMEWVEQDEPGVYITIRELSDGTRELRRVRFSRERFGEVHAKLWWEENRERIHVQYL